MKNKKVACVLGLLLCLSLVFGALNFSVFSMDAGANFAAEDGLGQFVSSADRSRLTGIEFEPKAYCNATIEDDFDGSSVLVVMDKNVSRINRVFNASFFGDITMTGIEDLSIVVNEELLAANDYSPVPTADSWAADYLASRDSGNTVECQCNLCTNGSEVADVLPNNWGIDRANFRQILQITLPTESKENVLDVIAKLEKVDGVISVEPNRIVANCIGKTPNDPRYKDGTQWAPNKISAPTAWDTTTGSSNVKVGVLESRLRGREGRTVVRHPRHARGGACTGLRKWQARLRRRQAAHGPAGNHPLQGRAAAPCRTGQAQPARTQTATAKAINSENA